MSKESLEESPRKAEHFVYRLGYTVASEIRSFLKLRNLGVKVVVLSEKDQSVLLVRHQYKGENLWYLPGGGVHSWERPDEALKREIHEEVILDINGPVLTGVYTGGKGKADLTFLFCCRAKSGAVEIVPTSEIEEAWFFSFNELPENLAAGVKERINEVVKKTEEGIFDSPKVIWGEW